MPPPFSSYADLILFSFSATVSFAALMAFPMTSFTFPNTCPTTSPTFLNISSIFPNADFTVSQTLFTASLNCSLFLYKSTNHATSPAINPAIAKMGNAFIANPSAFVATVDAVVAVVDAAVATVCAAVAAVPAVSAAVPAAVAAVFAVIFAMMEEMPETKFCPALIVDEMPCANFPIPIAAGPTAAVNIPILSMVCCCPSSSEPNHSHNVCTFSVNCSTNGAADDMIVCPNCSTVFFSSFIAIFMSYEVVCIFSNAVSVAPVDCLISFSVPLNESALSPSKINPAFAASAEENMSLMVRFSSFAAPSMICSTSARLEPLAMSSLNDFPVFSRRITSVVLPVFPNSLSIEFM